MREISIFICLMLMISVIPKFVAKPCIYTQYIHYLYDGEYYCGWIVFESYLMHNETDDVYLTIEVYPYSHYQLTINSFIIEIGDYKKTILKDAKIEGGYVKTINIPKDLLRYSNELEFEIHWKGEWSDTIQVDSGRIFPFIIIEEQTYYDLQSEYDDLRWKYDSLKENYGIMLSIGVIATFLDIVFLIIIIALVWERVKLKKKLQTLPKE